MLKVVNYINMFPNDWRDRLSAAPFCLKIKEEDGFIMFNYSQIESDFYNEIVHECRGLILRDNFVPACVPFYKFGNYGEGYTPDIDWDTARVQEKVDGSIIKTWYDDLSGWRVSTNGVINAYTALLQNDVGKFKTFGELFDFARLSQGLDYDKLDKENTYMFELTSPYNRVIVKHSSVSITHIGTRNNKTLDELDVDIGIKKPKSYLLSSLEDCIKAAEVLGYNNEGFVVVDGNWNRIKIKSPAYVALHHLKGNGNINKKRIVSLVRTNEDGEFLNYFPEYTNDFNEVKGEIEKFVKYCNEQISFAIKHEFSDRKDFAKFAKTTEIPHVLFCWYDGKVKNMKDWLWSYDDASILDWIERVDL
jgi:hypothetical protein